MGVENARIVEECIKATKLAVQGLEHVGDLGRIADVGLNNGSTPTGPLDVFGHRLGRRHVGRIVDGHIETALSRHPGGCRPDAARATGNKKRSCPFAVSDRSKKPVMLAFTPFGLRETLTFAPATRRVPPAANTFRYRWPAEV